MKNKLYNFFALVGFVTTFIIACSSYIEMDDIDEQQTSDPVQVEVKLTADDIKVDVGLNNETGKYQLIKYENFDYLALNTQTGEIKRYEIESGSWVERPSYGFTLTH